MNFVDVSITKVLSPPTQVVNDEFCCWEVTVETDCWGIKV